MDPGKTDEQYKARYEEIYKKIDDTWRAYFQQHSIAAVIENRNRHSGSEESQLYQHMRRFEKLIMGRTSFNELRPIAQDLYDDTLPYLGDYEKAQKFSLAKRLLGFRPPSKRAMAHMKAANVINDMMRYILEGIDHAEKELPPEYMDAEYNDIIKGLGKKNPFEKEG